MISRRLIREKSSRPNVVFVIARRNGGLHLAFWGMNCSLRAPAEFRIAARSVNRVVLYVDSLTMAFVRMKTTMVGAVN
jgi:hypothetical protein